MKMSGPESFAERAHHRGAREQPHKPAANAGLPRIAAYTRSRSRTPQTKRDDADQRERGERDLLEPAERDLIRR